MEFLRSWSFETDSIPNHAGIAAVRMERYDDRRNFILKRSAREPEPTTRLTAACLSYLRRHATSREHKLPALQTPDDPLDARQTIGVDLVIDDECGLVRRIEEPASVHDDRLARIRHCALIVGIEDNLRLRLQIDERSSVEGE